MASSDRLLCPPSELSIDPDAFNAFEAAGWQRKAWTYDPIAAITSRVITPLLDAARVEAGMRVLDIGSGPGHVAAQAAQRGAAVVGIDVATAMVERARRLHPGLDFREANAEALPFADGCFDAVVGNFSVVHFGRPEQAVGECVRVLKAGGQLALTVWDLPQRARWQGVFLDAVAAVDVTAPADVPPGPSFSGFPSTKCSPPYYRMVGSPMSRSRQSYLITRWRPLTKGGTVCSPEREGLGADPAPTRAGASAHPRRV